MNDATPRDLLMQPIRTVWIILVGDHPGIISAEFGQIPISGSREEGAGSILTQVANLNNFVRGPLDDAIYQIWQFWAL